MYGAFATQKSFHNFDGKNIIATDFMSTARFTESLTYDFVMLTTL